MKSNLTLFVLLALLQAVPLFAQRNPHREVLVYFREGVDRENRLVNRQPATLPRVSSARVKTALTRLGLNETALEVAMPRFAEADTLKTLPDGGEIAQANLTKLYRVHVPEGKSRQAVIDALRALPEVVYAEANGTVTPQLIPSDTRFNNQWGLRNTVTPGADIHAERAWDIFTGNPDNIIAVIDGGVDAHVDLNDKISGGDGGTGWDGHGIHVAGIAAAESNNA